MNLDVFVGVSERAESLSGFKAAYKQAEKAISGCSFLHMNERLFFFDDSKTAPPDDSFDRQISDLCGYIQKGRWAGVQGMFAKLLRRQVEARLTLEEIKNSGVVIESFCRRCLSQYNTRIEQVTEGSPPTPVIDVLSVDEYARTIREYIKAVMDYIDHAADNKTQLVAECDRLIAASDGMGINATSISRRLGVSSSYLSRVYKGKTGRTIIHAINMRKLERSKEYLDDPGVLIYEIAGHLGFENTTYFSHFFKKHTGMSPLAYRKRSPVIQKEPEGYG
jgi:two-component system response regulator YesN